MMASSLEKISSVSAQNVRKDIPAFDVGDTIKMKIKVKEADKIRIHPFEGTVIKKTGMGVGAAFTVRKISFGEGVERTFPKDILRTVKAAPTPIPVFLITVPS